MDFEQLKFWASLAFQGLNAVATAGVWLYVRYGDRNKQVDGKFDEIKSAAVNETKRVDDKFGRMQDSISAGLSAIRKDFDKRMDAQDKDVARLSGLIERAPTHDDLGDLYEKVNTTAQDVRQMAGELKGINDNLRLILSNIAQKGMQ